MGCWQLHYEYDKIMGARVAEIRAGKGWTQDQFAARLQLADCDLSRSTLGKIEIGQRHIYSHEIKLFKEILDVSYDDLFV